jgi:serine/threonine protein kinase
MLFDDNDVPPAFPLLAVHTPRLGKGLDKVAYRATVGGDDLALKILHTPVDDDVEDFDQATATERFNREILGMQLTNCPHIVKVLDSPQIREIKGKKYVWYTEPFLAGGTLHDRLRTGPLPPAEVHELAHCLFEAVEAMWAQKFVHRDIKPKNIAFRGDGTPVLIDLGIALFTDMASITSTSLVGPGTDVYAAPEQFDIKRLANIDFRTDLFQIGIVLVECLTGQHPFKGSANYYLSLTNFDPRSLDSVPMTDGLQRVIPRLLSSHQGRRFRLPEKALRTLEGP